MGVTSASRQGEADSGATGAPTGQLLAAGPVSDRCAGCGAPLASDQRYCVSCGERRGRPRFSVAGAAPAAPAQTGGPAESGLPRRQRVSSGVTLILGIGALLLAMLVGVLIGHNNSSSVRPAVATPPVQVVTVGGGGSETASTPVTGSAGNSGHAASKHSSSTKRRAVKKVVVTKQVATKATAAASKVLGGASNLASPTVQPGGGCSSGQAGCQNGKFTGNFFGGQ